MLQSPFPSSSSASGQGRIVARLLPNGSTSLETVTYQYPLKLISPTTLSADHKSALVFLLSYGGGLVAGDAVNLSIVLHSGAKLSIATQGHTKIFKADDPANVTTRQDLTVAIGDDAALCLLPDPVQPFEGSVYEQRQIFTVNESSSLCLLDWVTQGRTARGEDWSFHRWRGCNEIWLDNNSPKTTPRLLIRDAIILDADDGGVVQKPLRDTMHQMGVFGTLILRGPLVHDLGDFFVAEFAALPRIGGRDFRTDTAKEEDRQKMTPSDRWRAERVAQEQRDRLLWSAARVRTCVVVKFGAPTVEAGRSWLGAMLVQQGSIKTVFGSEALICIA